MAEVIIKLKRATAARWAELGDRYVLALGEPGYAYDIQKMKIGDGVTVFNKLSWIGEGDSTIAFVNTREELPQIGDSKLLYKISNEKSLVQWNDTTLEYETLVGGSFGPDDIKIINGGNANE